MTLTNTDICSEDIALFAVSEQKETKEWMEFFNKFNPYDVTIENQNKLRDQLEKVKYLTPNSEGNSVHFRDWKIENLIYACRADKGQVAPSTSMHAYGILIARMVLAFYLANKKLNFDNGQTIAEQIQALGFKLD